MEHFETRAYIPAPPATVFADWLSQQGHEAMTGAPATVDGATFTAWGGYIQGTTLRTEASALIVQLWQTSEFPEGSEPSHLEIALAAEGDGTRLTIRHSHIPLAVAGRYEGGWREYYFEPMTRYYSQGA